MFKKKFKIGKITVPSKNIPIVIAEAGVNHFGNFQKMKKLIDLASDAGADIFKTQFFITDELISSLNKDWYKRMLSKEVNIEFIANAKSYAEKKGLLFLCTPHDEKSFFLLKKLNLLAYKIGSGEKGNFKFLDLVSKDKKPLIISTGMHSMNEVESLLNFLSKRKLEKVCILHCISSYPSPLAELNLLNIRTMIEKFKIPVGYSDHCSSFLPSYIAISMGACIIEKHITIDYNIPNAQDWKVSAGPTNFKNFVKEVKSINLIIGNAEKKIRKCELPTTKWALKRIISKKDICKNKIISINDICLKRIDRGIDSSEFNEIIGKKIKKSVKQGYPILKKYF